MLLEYDLSVVGTANIDRAFASIERRAALHNVRMQQMFGGGSTGGSRQVAPRGSGTGAAGGSRSGLSEQERAQRQMFNLRMRQLRQEDAERKRTERSAEQDQLRTIRNAQRERERAERQTFSLRMRQLRQEDAERRRMDAREMRERERTRSAMLGNATRSAGGALRGVGSMAVGSLGIFGGFAAAGAVGENLNLGRRGRALAIQARDNGKWSVTPEQIQTAIAAESIRTGENRGDVLAGLEKMVEKTGNLRGGVDQLQMMGNLALAFNASREDITGASAVLGKQFGIENLEELADVMATLGAQGRKASFELSDMASLVESLAATGSRFDLSGTEGAKTLGGLVQIVRTTSRSGEQAATGTSALVRQLIAKSGDLAKGKFGDAMEVFEDGDPTKRARPIEQVIEDVISSTGGNKVALNKIFGDEGMIGATPFIKAYSQANQAAGGGDAGDAAGRQAIRDLFKDAIEVQTSYQDVQRDAADMLEDDSLKLSRAYEELKQAMGDALLPAVKEVTGALVENKDDIKAFISGMGEVVSYLIENPFKGIGAIVLAKVTADIATAAIGEAIKGQLLRAMAGGGGGGVAGGAAAGAARGGLLVAGGLVGGAVLADEGLQAAEEYVTGKPSTSGGIFGTMTGFGPAIEGLHRSAQMEGAPEWVKKASDFVRDPVDTLTASADDIAKAIQSGELKVRVVNPGDMVAAQPMNRSNSPTQPR